MNGKNCDKFWVPVTNVTGVTLKCHKNVTFAKNGPNGPKFGGPVRINSSNKAAKFGGPTAIISAIFRVFCILERTVRTK